MFEFLRDFLWFKSGELAEIIKKVRAPKPKYEADWESRVLMTLLLGIGFAFYNGSWGGVVYLWICKLAVQALNEKKFFDPQDPLRPDHASPN